MSQLQSFTGTIVGHAAGLLISALSASLYLNENLEQASPKACFSGAVPNIDSVCYVE